MLTKEAWLTTNQFCLSTKKLPGIALTEASLCAAICIESITGGRNRQLARGFCFRVN